MRTEFTNNPGAIQASLLQVPENIKPSLPQGILGYRFEEVSGAKRFGLLLLSCLLIPLLFKDFRQMAWEAWEGKEVVYYCSQTPQPPTTQKVGRTVSTSEPFGLAAASAAAPPAQAATPVRHVQVISQTQCIDPEDACGFHAFKNALVLLGLTLEFPGIDKEMLINKEFFNKFHEFVSQFKPDYEKDISIASLTLALKALSSEDNDIDAKFAVLKPLQKLCRSHPNEISMFNTADNTKLGGLDEGNLYFLSNLSTFAGEFFGHYGRTQHAFVTGSGNHWVTLILRKGVDGRQEWIAADSWNNQHTFFPGQIAMLERALHDERESRTTLKSSYFDAIGSSIRQKAGWLKPDGTLIDPKNDESLGGPGQRQRYLERIYSAYEFMTTVEWDSTRFRGEGDKEIQGYVDDLLIFAKYFQSKEPANPRLAEIIETLSLSSSQT